MSCGGYWSWTEECRETGCSRCSIIRIEGLPPVDCTCAATTVIGGFVYTTELVRSETCPIHGRCRCTLGPMKYDDHRERDYWEREWRSECPLLGHRK